MGKVKNLLKRFLQGTASDQDAQKVETWLDGAKNGDNPWENLTEEDRLKLLDELKLKIDRSKKAGKKNASGNIRWFWFGVAAVIIVLLVPIYMLRIKPPAITSPKMAIQKLTATGTSEVRQLVLSDGSKVWLNAESKLRYTDGFDAHSRDVYLEGQAYFEIVRDVNRPFVVHASSWQVTVLGTHFEVLDYLEDNDAAVAVLSGKVAVRSIEEKRAPVIINPGYVLDYNKKSHELNKGRFTHAGRPQWINKEVVFYHNSMSQVANFIKRNYGFTLTFSKPELADMEVSGDFGKMEDVRDLLEMICLTINAQYKMEGKNILITNIH